MLRKAIAHVKTPKKLEGVHNTTGTRNSILKVKTVEEPPGRRIGQKRGGGEG